MNKDFLDIKVIKTLSPVSVGDIQKIAENYFDNDNYKIDDLNKFVRREFYEIDGNFYWVHQVTDLCYALNNEESTQLN